MVESSKILTVSYGTFSCTLEGFDDSFGTMKAIAEYFRDLAADDRYFGAEPPTPDAQMLAKIAEREITRRVEARTEDGEIVLRADAPLAPAMPPKTARPDPVQVAAAAVAPQVIEPDVPVMDQTAPIASSEDATASEDVQDAGPEAEDQTSTLVASGQAAPDVQTEDISFDDMPPVADVEIDHHDAQSIAAKLERIRAVVGKSDAEDDSFQEDLSGDLMPEIADLPDEIVADHEDHADLEILDDKAPADEDAIADAPVFDMPTDPVMEAYDDDDADTFETAEGPDLSEFLETEAKVDTEEPLVLTAKDEVEVAQDTAADADAADDDAVLANLETKIAESADIPDAEDTSEPEEPMIRATIVRHPKEVATEAESPAEDEIDAIMDLAKLDGVDDVDAMEGTLESSLSAEEEQDLQEELAELEREYGADDEVPTQAEIDVEPNAKVEAEAELEIEAKADVEENLEIEAEAESEDNAEPETDDADAKPRQQLPEPDDAMMSHILTQTDEELKEPEGSRRRSAIAQLKAAVAATEAARSLGDTGEDATEAESAFRQDLDDVVRPSRPTRPVKPSSRTERPRPAPLKLVASQRIDAPETPADDAPVQPRRVAAAKPVITTEEASSFAEFAEQMGASELPELLEAAAAYTAFVEGNEDFSRPQIMQKVQLTVGEEISREDGLRCFGTLLREGRISKVRSGRFQVTEDTRYRPSA